MQEKLTTVSPHHFLAAHALHCMKFNIRLDMWWLISLLVRGPGGETLPPSGEFWGHISF